MPVLECRNILLLLFDSLSAVDACLSESVEQRPALSKLANEGVVFNNAYTPNPESSPARASLLTGLDPSVHGLWANGVTLPVHERTVPQRLSRAGYSTYLAGRYQLSGVSSWTTEQVRHEEFTTLDWAHGPLHRSRQNGYLNWLRQTAPEDYARVFPTQADCGDTQVSRQQRVALEALPDELSFNSWVGDNVGNWIEQLPEGRPFFAMAGFSVGDGLGAAPQTHGDIEALNARALLQADAAIGNILDTLSAIDRAQDTVVIVAAARGSASPQAPSHRLSEQAIRVPLIIHGTKTRRHRVDAPVSTLDIAPTILALTNAPVTHRLQGQSLLDVLDGKAAPTGWVMSRVRASTQIGERNWETAYRSGSLKLVLEHGKAELGEGSLRLYNLDADPAEQVNLAEHEAHVHDLESMIDQMIDARCALEDRTEPRIAEF